MRQRPSFWYAAPAFAFFALFAALPMVLVVFLSFTSWDGLGTPQPNGVDNWARLADDGQAYDAVGRTAILMVVSWLVQTPIALLIGVWAAGRQRSRAVLSSIFFLPLLLSTAAIALLWKVMLDPNFGVTQAFGGPLGDIQFLGDPDLALYTVAFVITWQYVPFHTLLYQGAARAIPLNLYEAATIDGAGRLRQFVHITLPQLRYTIITSSILMIVGSLTTFDTVLILTDGGGPGTASRIAPLHMYITGFSGFEMGYASTMAVLLVVVGTGLSLLVMRVTGYRSMNSQQEGA
ncbi:MAG: sugar ABC transporter permease [Umezawaea sp.]